MKKLTHTIIHYNITMVNTFHFLTLLFALQCDTSTATETVYHMGHFLLNISDHHPTTYLTIHHTERLDTSVFSTKTPFVFTSTGSFTAIQDSGNFRFTNVGAEPTKIQTVTKITPHCLFPKPIYQGCTSVTISGDLDNLAAYNFTLYQEKNSGTLRFQVKITPNKQILNASGSRIHLLWDVSDDEGIFGFGEQYTIHNLRDRIVPVVTTEQGVGRGKQPVSSVIDAGSTLHNAAGNWHTTYTAIPHYITSYSRSIFIDESRYSEFDFSSNQHGCNYTVIVGASSIWSVTGYIYHGMEPMDLIQRHTNIVGRMPPLPDWVSKGGLVVGWEGGTDTVLALHQQLISANVTIAGYWLQDWSGLRIDPFGKRLWWNWELDEEWYPHWKELSDTIAPSTLNTYMNPYLANTVKKDKKHYVRDLFSEASALEYLVKNSSNMPYIQSSASKSFTFGTIDLTNPKAREWTSRLIRCNLLGDQSGCDHNTTAIEAPLKGWMSDFGEYLPWDAVLHSGEPAGIVHNQFPYLWSEVCRNAVKDANMEGEVAFFSRSASSYSPSSSTLFWAGDQLTSWDEYDGMQSALRAILSGGLSGMSLTHSDTGGYTEVDTPLYNILRTEEILIRWMEMETFSGSMLRTHPGLLPTLSAQVNSSSMTLQATKFCSKIHSLLHPYRTILMDDAFIYGHPLARYMFLEFPNDSQSWSIAGQFMLGDMFLIKPVFQKNVNQIEVYLPRNTTWTHVFTRDIYYGQGISINIDAPIGTPVVLFRENRDPTSKSTIVASDVSDQMRLWWQQQQ